MCALHPGDFCAQIDAGADRFPWQIVVSEMVINFPHKQIVQALAFSAERDRSAMKVNISQYLFDLIAYFEIVVVSAPKCPFFAVYFHGISNTPLELLCLWLLALNTVQVLAETFMPYLHKRAMEMKPPENIKGEVMKKPAGVVEMQRLPV
jgi:hypothetical protein